MLDFARIFSVRGAAWTATIFIGFLVMRLWSSSPAMFQQWIEYKKAKASEKAADWTRLRDENKRIDERCQRLETAEERCRNELILVKERLAVLEGYEIGQGKSRQEAANIVAQERIEMDRKNR